MMVPVTAFQPPRWAIGFLVGVLTVSWVVMRTVSVPAARAGELEFVPEWSAPAIPPALSIGIPFGLPTPSAQAGGAGEQPSVAPIQVTGVEVAEAGPKSATIVIKTDRAVESYESFALQDPPRLVVDIPNAVHAAPKPVAPRGPITEIRSSQYKSQPVKVVRIVLDVRQVAGPVLRFRAAQHRLEPDKAVRIVADLKGQVRHDVVQTPEGIRLAGEGVRSVAAAPPAPPPPHPPMGD